MWKSEEVVKPWSNEKEQRKEVLPPMAKSQENGSTILLGLEGYEVGKVIGEEKGIVVELGTELKKPACPH